MQKEIEKKKEEHEEKRVTWYENSALLSNTAQRLKAIKEIDDKRDKFGFFSKDVTNVLRMKARTALLFLHQGKRSAFKCTRVDCDFDPKDDVANQKLLDSIAKKMNESEEVKELRAAASTAMRATSKSTDRWPSMARIPPAILNLLKQVSDSDSDSDSDDER